MTFSSSASLFLSTETEWPVQSPRPSYGASTVPSPTSGANMVAALIMDYCERNDAPVELDPGRGRQGGGKMIGASKHHKHQGAEYGG